MPVNYSINGMTVTINGLSFTLSSDPLLDKMYVFYDDGQTINYIEVIPNGSPYSLPPNATPLLQVTVPCNCNDLSTIASWAIIDLTRYTGG